MMSDCSSMRMQSTSCCFNSAGAPTRCFNSAADMVCLPRYALPIDLAADLAAPQVPGAHARGLVDGVGKPALLEVERGDRRTALERRGPVLDAGIDLGVHGAEHRRLQRRPAGDAAVCAHERDIFPAHDGCESHALW